MNGLSELALLGSAAQRDKHTCSVYSNKLLSISIKQGFKIPSFYSIFLPLDTQTHPSAAVKLQQWQQFERVTISGSSSRVCTHTPKFTFLIAPFSQNAHENYADDL